ncbi:hypothetical protein FE257_000637 [Aspergillus nanangensis]|uniref:medium-chain acyl-CoA ligase n=1 Tax=Aspergillus nanangensis TaxID=2582783 RepID=A0AAD4CET7_ASPNN|nr:hypothetical protein FE257_000637 [Aspergillus nanangensis]
MSLPSHTPSYSANSFNFTRDVVDYWGQAHIDPIAMLWKPPNSINPDELCSLTYSHFSRRARQVANGLRRLGVQKGDVILLVSSKTPEWYEIVCGAILSGVVICLCSSALTPAELRFRAQKTQALVFVGEALTIENLLALGPEETTSSVRFNICYSSSGKPSDAHVETYESLLDMGGEEVSTEFQTDPADACLLYFTSGTTAQPKIVKHTHVSYPFGHIITGEHWLDVRPGSILWNLSDQGWAKAMWAFFGSWSQGATLFVDADPLSYDPEKIIRVLHQYPITTFCAAPAIYRQLVTDESKQHFAATPPKALEHCTSAGENLESHAILEWYEMTDGLIIWNGFGQTETSILSGNYPGIEPKVGSMGKPLPGVPLYILNKERQIAHPFEEGDVAVRISDEFHGIFEGYVHDDGSVVRPLVQGSAGQPWYITGDRAHCDEDGYLWYKGRADDVIISAGHRIGPAEVESVLQSHPAIAESAVVAAPDKERGAIVKAFIVLHNNYSTRPEARLKQEIREHCLEHQAAQFCPQVIEFVEATLLPKTVSGKIIRRELRDSL